MQHKGVIHMHSTYSYDGKMSLLELKSFLIARGISFCCMTEHTDEMTKESARAFVDECNALSDDSFVFVPGFEVPYKNAHILHIGAEQFICQFADAEQLSAWRNVAPLVVLAHPVRNKFKLDESMKHTIDGVEVWNQQYEGKIVPRTRSLSLFRNLKLGNSKLLAYGGIDLHRKEHFGSPLVFVESDVLTKEFVVTALQQGDYIFGTDEVHVSPEGKFLKGGSFGTVIISALSILVIDAGKFVNKALASFGITLPKSLKQLVRSKV